MLLVKRTLGLPSYLALWAMLLGMFIASNGASASAISDLPDDLGDALGISTSLAGMIMSIGMIVSAALVLSVARMPWVGIAITLLSLMILLTAFGWLDQVVLIFSGIVTAIYFGITMKGLFGG